MRLLPIVALALHACGAASHDTGLTNPAPSIDAGTNDATGSSTGPIPGDEYDLVIDNLPSIEMEPLLATDLRNNPRVGIATSMRHLLVELHEEATVGEGNRALLAVDATLVGTVPEIGLVAIEFTEGSDTALSLAYDQLMSDPAVKSVTYDFPLFANRVPPPNDLIPSPVSGWDWSWNTPPMGDNWGLELIRAPAAWNLITAMRNRSDHPVPIVAAIDGFGPAHPDLINLHILGSNGANHGTLVAGIIGALWGNRLHVDGINPSVHIEGYSYNSLAIS